MNHCLIPQDINKFVCVCAHEHKNKMFHIFSNSTIEDLRLS